MLGVVATLKVKRGAEETFKGIFQELQGYVRANEPGCLQYDLFRAQKDPAVFVVMEQYASEAAFKAHTEASYLQDAGKRFFPLLDEQPKLEFLKRIS